MFSENNKISLRQLKILLILEIFGTGVIFLPRIVCDYSLQSGWIIVLISTIFAGFSIHFITSLISLFPDKNFYDMASLVLSKPLGFIFSVLFCVRIVFSLSMNLRIFAEIARQTILPRTPFYITILVFLLAGAYTASKGFETRARLAEILIFFAIIPIAIVFIIIAFDVDYGNLLPIFKIDTTNITEGVYKGLYSFAGLDLCLLVMPYMNKKSGIKKGLMQTTFIIGGLFLVVTVITIARFGAPETAKQIWPVLDMMDTVDIPGSFMERQEALVITFWIISVFAVTNAGLFFSSLLLKDTMKNGTHTKYILLMIPIVFLLSIYPKNLNITIKYLNLVNGTLGTLYLFIIPILILLVAKLRKQGVEKNA